MRADLLADLEAFRLVAELRSFTRAAARLGVSPSALSHAMTALEARLGLRLLARTTRSVAPTPAGERLLATLAPSLDDIHAGLAALADLRDRPSGMIRLNASDHAVDTVLLPRLTGFLQANPEVRVEVVMDQALTDIVAEGFDAGIRLGEQVDRDMVAVRIGPDIRLIVVGAPAYLDRAGVPQHPQDLTQHACLNLRLATRGDLYAWEFAQGGRALKVRVEGPLILNRTAQLVAAAREGLGLAFVPEDRAASDIAAGRLHPVLLDWCPPLAGHHLYYPGRRRPSAAFAALVEALRWRGNP